MVNCLHDYEFICLRLPAGMMKKWNTGYFPGDLDQDAAGAVLQKAFRLEEKNSLLINM